ncbi:VWA-like domain-containing protein [Streptomyces sp. NPDC050759]|uniref:vWA domain-containing protein n=1 Tax=Streptomyces sp. NPDC050759 TaxID=3365635 RepID=UPI003793D4E2
MEPGVRLTGLEGLPPDASQKWAAARVWAASQAPYLATALLALQPLVVDQSGVDGDPPYDLSRLPVDRGWRVYLDPYVLDDLDVPTIGYWLVHQVAHLLRDHAGRFPGSGAPPAEGEGDLFGRRSADSVRWNVSADMEINDDLEAGEVKLPPEAPLPEQLELPDSWLAEQYWHALEGREVPAVDCGSATDARPRDWETHQPGLDGPSTGLIRREVARRVKEALEAGRMTGGWARWAEEVLSPKENWRQQFASAIRRGVADAVGRVDFTYERPSRRSGAAQGVILPSMRQPLPRVAIVIDTSASMRQEQLAQALGEVNGVVRAVGVGRRELHVICCDERAYDAQRVLDARALRLEGGGGTDLGEGLRAASELRPRPHVLVVLTDGHTPWPDRPPAGPRVVVGVLDADGSAPGWAKRVMIDTGGEK